MANPERLEILRAELFLELLVGIRRWSHHARVLRSGTKELSPALKGWAKLFRPAPQDSRVVTPTPDADEQFEEEFSSKDFEPFRVRHCCVTSLASGMLRRILPGGAPNEHRPC